MENKKIRGAISVEYKGIKFRSKLEVMIFKVLEKQGFAPLYEPEKHTIWKGFRPTIPFFIKNKKTGQLELDKTKIIDITYTPDIEFIYGKYVVYVEVKPAFENDVFPYKKKLFRKYLEDKVIEGNLDYSPIYVQVGTKRHLLQFIKILKECYNEKTSEINSKSI